MKKILGVLAALCLSQAVLADDHGGATDEVLALIENLWEARNENDYKTQRDAMTDGKHYNANSSGAFFYVEEKPSLEELAEDLAGEYDVRVVYPNAVALTDDVILARYYLEGSITVDGREVNDYRTRVSHIWIREGRSWKSKSWHFSPLHKGGTVPR